MEAIARDDVTLARVRTEFDQWRSGRSGRGRIPDRLWRLAVSLLDSFSTAVVCRELHLSAGDLRKHRQARDAKTRPSPPATPAFVELRAVDLVPQSPSTDETPASVRAVLDRADGSRLTLELSVATTPSLEVLIATFLRR
jgi:hypothetical protein